MNRLTLDDINKMQLTKFLFDVDEYIWLDEYVLNIKENIIKESNSYKLYENHFDDHYSGLVNVDSNYTTGSISDSYSYKSLKYNHRHNVDILCNKKVSAFTNNLPAPTKMINISIASKITIDKSSEEKENIYYSFKDNIDTEGYNFVKINIMYPNSISAPIVRIIGFNEFEDAQNYKFSFDIEEGSEGLLFNSFLSKFNIEKEVINTTSFNNIKLNGIKEEAYTKFMQSSFSKNENIMYNSEGVVIYYNNPVTGISMSVDNVDNNTVETIKLGDVIVDQSIINISTNKFGKTLEYYYDRTRDPIVYHVGEKIKYHGKDRYIVTYDNNDFVDYIDAKKYEADNKDIVVLERFKDNVLLFRSSAFNPSGSIDDGWLDTMVKYYHNNKEVICVRTGIFVDGLTITTYSDISNINFVDTYRASYRKYKDNDIMVEINDEPSKVISYYSDLIPKSDKIYIRDQFGIPRLIYKEN